MRGADDGVGDPNGRPPGAEPDRAPRRRDDRNGAGQLPVGGPGTATPNTFPPLLAR